MSSKAQPLVQLFDDPARGDLASFKAQATMAKLALQRAKALALRQFGPQATVDDAQATYDQANASIAKTKAIISQDLILAPFDGELGLPSHRGRPIPQHRRRDRHAHRSLATLCEFHRDGKEQRGFEARPGRARHRRCLSEPHLCRQDHHDRAADQHRYAQHFGTSDVRQPGPRLKPGMFATATVELPTNPPVMTVPETAADYSLYGDFVFLIKKSKDSDGKETLTAVRTFVQDGRAHRWPASSSLAISSRATQVAAVGQIKLQSGAEVAVSPEPPPPIPAQPSPY